MTALLSVHGLTRRFGGLAALRDVSFELQPGEILGLIGPNGAGKTTCFNVIAGVYRPSQGDVRFDGESIAGLAPSAIVARGLGRTFQAATVFPAATVEENVLRGAFVRTPRRFFDGLWNGRHTCAAEAAARREAAELLADLGLADVRDVPAGSLSYGHQKRLGVAIALAARPKLLLMDEPVAGLNPEESAEFGELIARLRAQRALSILLVEHHMQLVMALCHRIVVLDHGRKIAEGTPAQVRADPAVIEAYLGTDVDGLA